MNTLLSIWHTPSLRNKILFVIFGVIVYRVVSHIPVPGVNLDALLNVIQNNQALSAYSMLTGGSLQSFSIVLMGLSPYINAVIIIQLLSVVVPYLAELTEEGESGQKVIKQYTRYLTVVFAFAQSYGMILLLNTLSGGVPVIADLSVGVVLPIMISITAGSVFLMWLGELMTDKGISNGISLLIFAGIVSALPNILSQLLGGGGTSWAPILIISIITLGLIAFIVWFTEGRRDLTVIHASRGTQSSQIQTFLPVKVNQAGMIPIIFAISLVTFPSLLANVMSASSYGFLQSLGQLILTYINPNNPNGVYIILYFALVVFFSFFYVSIVFKPDKIAENLQKRGGFIPGVRPGEQTAELLSKTSINMNLFGGSFLAFVAIFPFLLGIFTKEFGLSSVPLLISGAGLIIVVNVALDFMRQVKAQMAMHNYNKFI